MKKIILFTTLLTSLFILIGCGNSGIKADIITTMFPQYDIARKIASDKLDVTLMTPVGTEVHNYEPSSQQLIDIKKSKLFIFTSFELDSWVTTSLLEDVSYLNMSDSHAEIEYPGDDFVDFSHFWTDPVIFIHMIDDILDSIIEIDPENIEFYTENATTYKRKIQLLHDEMFTFLKDLNTTFYFAGHNSMENFSKRYQINLSTLHSDFEPDADLTSSQLKQLVDEIKTNDIHYLFVGELTEENLSKTIIREMGSDYHLNILELHSYHNVSLDDFKEGITYYQLMLNNFNHLKIALEGFDESNPI